MKYVTRFVLLSWTLLYLAGTVSADTAGHSDLNASEQRDPTNPGASNFVKIQEKTVDETVALDDLKPEDGSKTPNSYRDFDLADALKPLEDEAKEVTEDTESTNTDENTPKEMESEQEEPSSGKEGEATGTNVAEGGEESQGGNKGPEITDSGDQESANSENTEDSENHEGSDEDTDVNIYDAMMVLVNLLRDKDVRNVIHGKLPCKHCHDKEESSECEHISRDDIAVLLSVFASMKRLMEDAPQETRNKFVRINKFVEDVKNLDVHLSETSTDNEEENELLTTGGKFIEDTVKYVKTYHYMVILLLAAFFFVTTGTMVAVEYIFRRMRGNSNRRITVAPRQDLV